MRKFLINVVCGLIVAGLMSGAGVRAQSTSGAVAGTVLDPAGRPVSGAVLHARFTETGVVRTTITDSKGQYRFETLTTGRWAVTARPAGGADGKSEVVNVSLQAVVRLDFTFESSGTERVEVTAETPMPDRRQTAGKLLVSRDQIDRVPLTGRIFTDLAKLDSSVGDPSGAILSGERGAAFVVNGQGGRTNSFLIGSLLSRPSSTFAQGTSGALSENSDFIGSLPGGGDVENDATRFQYGFNFGGAFKKDKAFYFFAFERQDLSRMVPYTGLTADEVFGGAVLGDSVYNNVFFRTDYNLGNSNQLMVRLTWDRRSDDRMNIGGVRTPENGFEFKEEDFGLAASLQTIASPRVVNEVRFMAALSNFDQLAESLDLEVARPSGITGGNALSLQARDETRFQLVDNVTVSSGNHTMKFGADVTWSSIDLATEFNPMGGLIYKVDRDVDPQSVPLDDLAASVFLRVYGAPADTFDDTRVALFAQDSWDINESWHLNYGLRYDVSTFELDESARVDSIVDNGGAQRDTDNIAPRFGFTYTPGANSKWILRGGAGVFYDKLVLGFPAVSAITSQTQIRLFFPLTVDPAAALLFEEIIRQATPEQIDSLWPDEETQRRFAMRFSTAPELDTPYTMQYNLGFDLTTTPRSVFRVNAVRSLGYNVPLMLDLNPVDGKVPNGLPCAAENFDPDGIVPCHLDDPDVGSIVGITTEGRSWYWALDTSWRWQSAEGGWFSASYTLSRAEDEGFDPLKNGVAVPPDSRNLSGERGRSDADRRHRLVLSGDVPLGWWELRLSGVARYNSGAPFNVTTGQDNNLDGILTDRPAGVTRNTGDQTDLAALNAFRVAEGLAPVNDLDEPSFFQIDLRVYKRFPFNSGKGTGEVFLQVFNLINRENYATIEGRATARNFGEGIALAGPPRSVELGLRFGY